VLEPLRYGLRPIPSAQGHSKIALSSFSRKIIGRYTATYSPFRTSTAVSIYRWAAHCRSPDSVGSSVRSASLAAYVVTITASRSLNGLAILAPPSAAQCPVERRVRTVSPGLRVTSVWYAVSKRLRRRPSRLYEIRPVRYPLLPLVKYLVAWYWHYSTALAQQFV
jgi:hypothetical protein